MYRKQVRAILLTNDQEARLIALRDITNLLNAVEGKSAGLSYASDSNPYMSEDKKKRIRRERRKILWQLDMRQEKLERFL